MYFHLIIYYLLYSSKHLFANVLAFCYSCHVYTYLSLTLSIENETHLVPYEVIIPCLM